MKRFFLTILIIAVLVLIVAVATGFLNLNTSGRIRAPEVAVTAKGGELPKVDVDTKKVVVGTTETNVAVPSIGIDKSTVRVPTVAVRDDSGANQQPQPQPQPQPKQ